MHEVLVDKIVSEVRARRAQGDCPTIEPVSREMLEQALEALADRLDRVRAMCDAAAAR